MGFMIRFALALAVALLTRPKNPQPSSISYQLAMSHPASHLFEVSVDVTTPVGDNTPYVDFQMPLWQPGRYSVADFAANVQEFAAQSQGRSLSWTKIDDQTWRVQKQGSRSVSVRSEERRV